MTRERRADARANRERIAAAAREVLAADPRASMAQIAERAGLSRVTLYGHVGSRAELMAQVVAEHVAAAAQSLRVCVAQPLSAQLLREVIADSWHSLSDSRPLIIEAEAELGADAVRLLHEPVLADLSAWFAAGQAAGVVASPQDPGWLAHAYYGLVRTAVALTGPEVAAQLGVSVAALLGVPQLKLPATRRDSDIAG